VRKGSSLSSLIGSLELAQFDDKGLDRFDLSRSGYWRSFSAVLVAVPVYLLVLYLLNTTALRYQRLPESYQIALIAYLAKWAVFAVIMLPISHLLGARDHYFSAMTVYNWCNPVARSFFLPAYAASAAGLANIATLQLLIIVSFALAGTYLAYIFRTALQLPFPKVVAIVLLDFFLERIMLAACARLFYGLASG